MAFIPLAPVVQRLDSAIHRIDHYPVDRIPELLEVKSPRSVLLLQALCNRIAKVLGVRSA